MVPRLSYSHHMHRAFSLEEILYAIFVHCHPEPYFSSPPPQGHSDLVALSHWLAHVGSSKSPHWTYYWAELEDITPLARCLPRVSFLSDSMHGNPVRPRLYAVVTDFTVLFIQETIERNRTETVKIYIRRVRALSNLSSHCHLGDCAFPSRIKPFLSSTTLLFQLP